MLDGLQNDLLAYVATEMFESTAFMFLEEGEGGLEDDEVVRAEIGFTHDGEHARLVLAASRAFCTELAANFLGLDEDDEQVSAAMDGAVAEMANIIAGFLTAQLFGSAVIQLEPPTSGRVTGEALAAEARHAASRAVLESEEGGRVCMLAFPGGPT